ncbi:hypothetical protein [Anoxynatronum sibiricum]|uniref:Zinc-finger domain-containing protein n=1 Tax=Anoxynatronum sibiricum TaxID=210623 RepID=A0ABU9VSV1_9CLOT
MSATQDCYSVQQMEDLLEQERKGCLEETMAALFYTHLGQCPACQHQAYALNRLETLLQKWGSTLNTHQRSLLSVLHISVHENTLRLKSMGQALKDWGNHSAPQLHLAPVVLRGEDTGDTTTELMGVSQTGDRSVSIATHDNILRIRLEGFLEEELPEVYLQAVSTETPPRKLTVTFTPLGSPPDHAWEAQVTDLPPGDHLVYLEEPGHEK